MSDEQDDSQKTEEPTHKRLADAREKGQVAISREVSHWFIFLGFTIFLLALAPMTAKGLALGLSSYFHAAALVPAEGAGHALRDGMQKAGMAMIAFFVVMMAAGIAGPLLQAGPMLSWEQVTPKLEKISILRGMKRLFSLRALVEFIKGIIKLLLVGICAWMAVADDFAALDGFAGMDVAQLLPLLQTLALKITGTVLAVMTLITALDVFYQRWEHIKSLRMSKQELKEEYKQSEGDPMVKARLRQLRMEKARRRMMAEVPKADVIITNPTHYAVALKYEQGRMGAPVVVAKGVETLALKIREVAGEHNVPIMESPPLARAIYAAVEVGQEIRAEHYKAVAEILGIIWRKHGRKH